MTAAAAPGALPPAKRLGVPVKLAYGFGSLAYGIKDNGFSTLLLLFYNQLVGLPAGLVGLAIFIALVLDAGIDPLVGYLSDHLRTRWGRRHPFMYASAIPVGLLYLLLWSPPVHAGRAVLVGYLVAVAILVRTAISCYEVPSAALTPELTSDYHERTSVVGYRYMFGWVGGMGMLLLTFLVFLAPTARYPVGQLNPQGYRTYAVVASALMIVSILLSSLGTHRRIRTLPQAPARRGRGPWDVFRGIWSAFKNRAFAVLMISGVFSYTAQGLNFALSTYFNTFLWGFPASTLAIFTACVLAGVGLAFALAAPLSRAKGKRWTTCAVTFAYVVLATAPLLLRLEGWFPANDSPWLLPLLMSDTVLAAALGVGGAILGASMMADVVEDHQLRTGERAEGIFAAGSFFMQKCVSGLGLFLSGLVLTLVHFPSHATPGRVSGSVLSSLIILYSVLFGATGLLSAVVLTRFPLGQGDHEARLRKLAEDAAFGANLPGGEPDPAAALAEPRRARG